MKIKISFFALTVILLLGYFSGGLAEEKEPITIGEKFKIHSRILNEDRQLWVYLPNSYARFHHTYPVLYLLDGGYHFHHVSGIVQFLSANNLIPEMIIVALPNTYRDRDLSPTPAVDLPGSGGADNFLKFMKDELFPYVEKNYRTQPFRVLVGHSLGGLFACYSCLCHPDLFQASIAISPWLIYDDNYLLKKAPDYIQKLPNEFRFLYLTAGDEKNILPAIEKFGQLLNASAPKRQEWKFVEMKDDNHGSVVHLSIYNGLLWLYQDWKLPFDLGKNAVTTLTQHFERLSKKFGYDVPIQENFLNRLGYQILNAQIYDQAIEVFKLNVEKHPESANVHDSLGEAYEGAGQFRLAQESYAHAVKLGKESKDPNLEVYQAHLKRVTGKGEGSK